MHIVVDRAGIGHRDAIIFTSPIDGRVLFILPWGDLSYIGTTDTDTPRAARQRHRVWTRTSSTCSDPPTPNSPTPV